MGLDIVNMTVEVEKSFKIRIPDAEAQKIRTVGLLIDCVHDHVKVNPHQSSAQWTRKEVAERVRLIVSENLGVNLKDVKEESRFVEDFSAD